jgi:chromosome partitioning protein
LFLKLIQKIRAKINPGLFLEGILVTMNDGGEASAQVLEEIKNNFPPSVLFDTIIPFDETIEIASMKAIPIGMLSGGEEAAQAYMNLAVEFKTREMNAARGKTDENEGLF